MTGFVGGFICAILLVAAVMCLIWAINELNSERHKRQELEVRVAQMSANREKQNVDIK